MTDFAVRSRPASRHWRGLDGLRAIAVITVVIYHFSPTTLPGGFLGVDIFFVISGYLITRIITTEFLRRHHIRAGAFYHRRARRLLPALAVLLAVVASAALIWRDQLATIRPAVVFSALFSANWWLALDHQTYFVATGRPSMLQHLWSLGVEEQFYLIWPLVAATTLAAARRSARRHGGTAVELRRTVRRLSAVAVTLAMLSTGLGWLLADLHNVPYGDDGSTLYYGTDTHCMGLLLGAALGAWAAGGAADNRAADDRAADERPERGHSVALGRLVDPVGTVALIVVLVLTRTMAGYSHSLYRGGLLGFSALVVVVIAAATRPGSRLGATLDAPLLRWIGVRSYSIYLWHWPIAVVSRPGIDTTMPGWIDQVVRIALTVGLADATYRFVETPTRRLGVRGAVQAAAARLRQPSDTVARPAFAAFASVVVVAAGVILIGPAAPRPAAAVAGTTRTHITLGSAPSPAPYVGPRQQPHPTPSPRLPKISGFGDSVLLDARHTLAATFAGGTIDAKIGEQPGPILEQVRRADRSHSLNPVVVIHAGNNGLINPADLEHTLAVLSSPHSTVQEVLVVNDHLDPYDSDWQTPNNATITRIVAKFPHATVVNWNAAAGAHHNWLYPDDLHLRPPGAAAYAALLANAYRRSTA